MMCAIGRLCWVHGTYLILDVVLGKQLPLSAQSSKQLLKLFTELAETTVLGRPFQIVLGVGSSTGLGLGLVLGLEIHCMHSGLYRLLNRT